MQIQELYLDNDITFVPKGSSALSKRYIYYPDHIVQLPPYEGFFEAIGAFFSEPIFHGTIMALLQESGRPAKGSSADESVGSFLTRRLNRNYADNFASAVLHGIYAGDVWQLSMSSILPSVRCLEQHYNSLVSGYVKLRQNDRMFVSRQDRELEKDMRGFDWFHPFFRKFRECSVFYFAGGMQVLPETLSDRLKEFPNVTIRTGTPLKSIERATDTGKLKVGKLSAGC